MKEKYLLTKEKALDILRYKFHKTRLTHNLSVEPDIIAAVLGYEIYVEEEVPVQREIAKPKPIVGFPYMPARDGNLLVGNANPTAPTIS